MRTLLRSALLSAALLGALSAASAQHLSINIGVQPIWGPVGYDHVEYYYLPDIDSYYYVPQHQFIYEEGGQWRRSASLPSRYGNYDLYNSHTVVVNDRNPYRHPQLYRDRYGSFKGARDQQPIRDSRETRYFENKDHPEHGKWMEQNGRPRSGNRGNSENHRRDDGNRGNGENDQRR
jgi:hypothetical protein